MNTCAHTHADRCATHMHEVMHAYIHMYHACIHARITMHVPPRAPHVPVCAMFQDQRVVDVFLYFPAEEPCPDHGHAIHNLQNICAYIYIYIYVYIYIYIERERERERCINIRIYTYMFSVGYPHILIQVQACCPFP